jgi:hypothetical protein
VSIDPCLFPAPALAVSVLRRPVRAFLREPPWRVPGLASIRGPYKAVLPSLPGQAQAAAPRLRAYLLAPGASTPTALGSGGTVTNSAPVFLEDSSGDGFVSYDSASTADTYSLIAKPTGGALALDSGDALGLAIRYCESLTNTLKALRIPLDSSTGSLDYASLNTLSAVSCGSSVSPASILAGSCQKLGAYNSAYTLSYVTNPSKPDNFLGNYFNGMGSSSAQKSVYQAIGSSAALIRDGGQDYYALGTLSHSSSSDPLTFGYLCLLNNGALDAFADSAHAGLYDQSSPSYVSVAHSGTLPRFSVVGCTTAYAVLTLDFYVPLQAVTVSNPSGFSRDRTKVYAAAGGHSLGSSANARARAAHASGSALDRPAPFADY